ncbi:MAG: type II toxin-antitoxin system VapB family antitoxin [Thermoleophilaceae bacterium]|nr:type II toxin-antitoxin system VapB family antitoxin [Thermoleophilaceae bacterium]
MGRTNIEIDDALIRRVMLAYDFGSMREAVDYALRQLVGDGDPKGMLSLEGSGWEGDLDVLRGKKPPPSPPS